MFKVVCPFKRLNTWCCIAINLLLRTITIMEPNTADEKDEELFARYDGPCKYMVKACLACILKAKSPDKSLMEGWTIRLMFEKPYSCAS
jgi:hypothetical protein